MTRLEEWEHKNIVTASMVISDESEIITDWGVDVRIDIENVIFDQGIRNVVYPKSIIKEMKLCVNAAKGD